MKKAIITLLLSITTGTVFAQNIDPIKEINKILNPSDTTRVVEGVNDLEKFNLSSHLVLDKTNSIVKVQVQSSLGKVAVGSGSIIREDGLIVTNYHVISSNFTDPSNTQIVFSIGKDPEELSASLEAVDLVNDLALLKPTKKTHFKNPLFLETRALYQGQKIYSLGFPHNWSMTMIEGLFNGFMDKQMVSHYLVSNALSPGMSGGPTFNEDGNLVAINVAATNKLSILIPVASLKALIERYTVESRAYPENKNDKFKIIRNNAISRYADFSNKLLTNIMTSDSLNIGQFKLPLKNSLLECWSRREKQENNLDKIETKQKGSLIQTERLCATQDNIFLEENTTLGQIGVGNYYYQNNSASSFSFWKTIEKKYNIIATKNQSASQGENGQCFINNVTNKNKQLQKMQICITPFKETNRLWSIQISQLYQSEFKEAIILNYLFNGFTEENINKIIGFTKKI